MKIQKVVAGRYCLGCGLCVADVGGSKLRMELQDDGFYIPVPQNGFDGDVPDLRAYCPGITIVLKRPLRTADEKFYGPFSRLQVAYAKDEAIRFKGSSGGVLTAIACALIEKKLVDGILHVGASRVDPVKTDWCFSTTTDQVVANAGSRYAPSSLLVDFRAILERYGRIAVVGKPCDIAAARQFLEIHPEYEGKVYCLLSFMCMGMPSQNATSRLLRRLGIEDPAHVAELNYRGNGWPGEASATTCAGGRHTCSYNESWGQILGRDVLFRCKICPDGWGSFADLSAGDAWHSDGDGPLFHDRPGRSLLFCRSGRGASILAAAGDAIAAEAYGIQELPIVQKAQCARKRRVWIAYAMLKMAGGRALRFKGLGMMGQAWKSPPKTIAKEALQTVKRIAGNKRKPKRNLQDKA